MHSNLWRLCQQLSILDIRITLLCTGLLLKRHGKEIVRWCDEVIVSLDGSREVHNAIRRITRAYQRLSEGVIALRALKADLRITGHCVLQRMNYQELSDIITAAHDLGLDQISFLAADVSTTAFNRPDGWDQERVDNAALTRDEVGEFNQIMEETIIRFAKSFDTDFIAEKPDNLRNIVQYYAALNGQDDFPETVCNAPWVSTVIEADGTVRPCFFHNKLGNINEETLGKILNLKKAVDFRHNLDVKNNPICKKYVCTLTVGRRAEVAT